MYSKKVSDHFMSSQNIGSMPNADGEGTVEDLNKKDTLTIYVKVQFRIITDVNFMAIGSTATVAAGSLISILAKGKCIDEAMTISEQDIIDNLEELPKEERYCANMAVNALRKAIENYAIQRGIYSCQLDNEVYSGY